MPEPALQYPELPPDLQQGLTWRALKYFGAGAIIASVTIGSGETLFASRGGALFGYTLLWCFVAGTLMKGIQVYTAARYMTLTGEHPMTHWSLFPGPRGWVPLTIGGLSLLCFPFWLSGLPLALGTLLNWIVGLDGTDDQLLFYARVWGTVNTLLIVALTGMQSYKILEKGQVFIVGLLLSCMFAAVFAARPDWFAALHGLAVPTIPDHYEPWIAETYASIASRPPWVEIVTYLGAVGGGTYDYVGYIGCFREKAWGALGRARRTSGVSPALRLLSIDLSERNVARGKRWLLPAQIDTGMAFFCVFLFTVCFVVLGAVILHPQQVIPDGNDLLTHQAQFLTNVHPSLLLLYQVGIFFAFWGTIYGAYEIYARTAFECCLPVSRKIRTMPYEKFRGGVLLYCATFGLLLLWTLDDPVAIVTPAALLGGVFTCGLWCFLMIWADRRFLPGPLRMGKTLLTLTALSGAALTAMGTKAIWDYLMGLLT